MNPFRLQGPIPARRLLAAPLACALLVGGCASTPAATGPASAALGEVNALAGKARGYPSFTAIPELPVDGRPMAAWGRAASEVLADGAALQRDAAEETWTLRQSEAFAARVAVESGPPASTVSATTAAEAFARDIRKRATLPPPPPR